MLFHATKWLPRKLCILNITCENELIIDFVGQNETKYIRISILLLSAYTEKNNKIKAKDTCKNQSESKKWKNSFAERRNNYGAAKEIKTKVENQKDHKNEPVILR